MLVEANIKEMLKGIMKKKSKLSALVTEVIKYGAVGAVSTALDYLFLNLSFKFMHNDAGLLWLATAIGFGIGMVNGYFMNSRWTFRFNTNGQESKKFSQFAVVSLVGLGLTELIVLSLSLKLSLDKNVAKLVAVAIVFVWNYLANKFWTFKKQ